MSYLRFTPDDYHTLADISRRLDLGGRPLPSFRRLLLGALAGAAPDLADRIRCLRRAELYLLYRHFRTRPHARGHGLNDEEWRTLAVACVEVPFPVRFVRPFKGLLADMLRGPRPDLAEKVARMSGHQFVRLYNRAVGREWWEA